MREHLIIGNWKMHGCLEDIALLLAEINKLLSPESTATYVVLPPAIYIPTVRAQLSASKILWGAQNVYPQNYGAYTGELSGPMLHEYGCKYVLVGHSERRHLFQENDEFIAEKFKHVKQHGMIPILCVGETKDEREQGLTETIILKQLQTLLSEHNEIFAQSIIAYEPVWAIGTGQVASTTDAQNVHAFIRNTIAKLNHEIAINLPIIYGGSVNETNAHALFAMPDIDGGLVGGASLNAQKFVKIVMG